MAVYSVLELKSRWANMDWGITTRQFFLPVWLSLLLLPLILVLAVQSAYTATFAVARTANELASLPLTVKLALIVRYNFMLRRIEAFGRSMARELGLTPTWAGAMAVVNKFNAAEARKRRERRIRRVGLQRHAGNRAVDDRGRRLDRREFERTKRILSLLAMRQLGHHRNGGRYDPHLVAAHPADFSMDGIATVSDLTLIVAEDGRSWHAWRRTVTGWCFAIGASRPPNDQWKYDGAEPPQGAPESSPGWTDDIRELLPADSNWHGLA